MTCLSIIQTACSRLSLTVPTTVATQDQTTLQMLALLNEEGSELSARNQWQALTKEATFTTVATELQGTLNVICPNLGYIINDTIWNRTIRRPVFGPLGAQYWQQQKAMFSAGPWNQYRVKGNTLNFFPAPAAGQQCYFEYVSRAFATDSTGATDKTAYTLDTDLSLHSDDIMILGLIWRFKAAKGFDFTVDFAKYEARVIDAIGKDASKPILSMGEARYDIMPVVMIPSGSWGV